MKNFLKGISVLLSVVMILTSLSFTTIVKADTEKGQTDVSLLNGAVTSSNDAARGTGDNYDGYIASCYDMDADYLKITYTIDNPSKLQSWTWLFHFMPYTSSWEGWECNAITLSDSTYDNGEYTACIPMKTIKESCVEGDVAGVNLGYCEVEGVTLQLTGFYKCAGKITSDTEVTDKPSEGTEKADIPETVSTNYRFA